MNLDKDAGPSPPKRSRKPSSKAQSASVSSTEGSFIKGKVKPITDTSCKASVPSTSKGKLPKRRATATTSKPSTSRTVTQCDVPPPPVSEDQQSLPGPQIRLFIQETINDLLPNFTKSIVDAVGHHFAPQATSEDSLPVNSVSDTDSVVDQDNQLKRLPVDSVEGRLSPDSFITEQPNPGAFVTTQSLSQGKLITAKVKARIWANDMWISIFFWENESHKNL
ncbi:hypothetical protein SNE40_016549 [Patella caerulea]|uniref:Uncharacterized protein n=1 Tax=Patella caerulea TaxID=87958 RepID=A0AAN8PDR9_PATCE